MQRTSLVSARCSPWPPDRLLSYGAFPHRRRRVLLRLWLVGCRRSHDRRRVSGARRTCGLRTRLEVTLADPDPPPDPGASALRSACQEALALGGHQEQLVQALLALATSERGVARWDPLDLAE